MRYTADDVRRHFDGATYGRGAGYHRGDMVLEASLKDGVVQGKVRGSSANHYRQSVKLVMRGARLEFEGDCSCPMEYNCKHVVAVLLAVCETGGDAMGRLEDGGLSYEMSRWLSALAYQAESALRQQSVRKPAAKPAHRLIYVLMPQPGNGRLRLHLCRGRIAADGAIRSATPINDPYGFYQAPPAYMRAEDHAPATTFGGLLKGSWGATALDPLGETASGFLLRLGEMGVLYQADRQQGLRAGLRPLRHAPARTGGLAWCADEVEPRLRLRWAFDDGDVIDHVLPTIPPLYLKDDSVGRLDLPGLPTVLPMTEWLSVVARAPLLEAGQAAEFARELLASGMKELLPLPRLEARLRAGVRPKPVLMLGSAPRRTASGGVAQADYGLLAFEYDGQRVGADPRIEVIDVGDDSIDTIARHQEDEAAA